jgi:DNA polymerase III sliding clamp (beta) subunit (PCNA family)
MNVEIEIPVPEFKAVLPGLAKIISRSSRLPVLQSVKVSLSQDEKFIELQAHNLDEIATVRLPNKANGLSGHMIVPYDMLAKIVKGCGADQSIRFIATTQETKIRYSLAGSFVDRAVSHIPVEEWPEVKVIEGEPVELDDAFKVAVWEALECASVDSSRHVLNGACLDKGVGLCGHDGHKLMLQVLGQKIETNIPAIARSFSVSKSSGCEQRFRIRYFSGWARPASKTGLPWRSQLGRVTF